MQLQRRLQNFLVQIGTGRVQCLWRPWGGRNVALLPHGDHCADNGQSQDATPSDAARRGVEDSIGQRDRGARQGKPLPCRARTSMASVLGHVARHVAHRELVRWSLVSLGSIRRRGRGAQSVGYLRGALVTPAVTLAQNSRVGSKGR